MEKDSLDTKRKPVKNKPSKRKDTTNPKSSQECLGKNEGFANQKTMCSAYNLELCIDRCLSEGFFSVIKHHEQTQLGYV